MTDLLLYTFWSNHKKVSLKGIGLLQQKTLPAEMHAVDKQLFSKIALPHFITSKNAAADEVFIGYCAAQGAISIEQASQQYEQYLAEKKEMLQKEGKVSLGLLGDLCQTEGGNFYLQTAEFTPFYPSISIDKVTRPNELHAVKVGDREETNVSMKQYLDERNKKTWTVYYWSIIVLLILLGFLGYLFYNPAIIEQWK